MAPTFKDLPIAVLTVRLVANNTETATPASALCDNPSFYQDDPDIAGPGILIGFMLSSMIAFLLSGLSLYLQNLKRNRITPNYIRRYSPDMRNPVGFWADNLENFVLSLSDQQLLTSFLLLICAYAKYYRFSVQCGSNNLWDAADIVCFANLTHAVTLLVLRSFFRRHKILATARVVAMYIVYGLWLVIIINILTPDKRSSNRPKLSASIAKFWHAFIEVFSVMALYLATYLPIFLTREATRVRICIAINTAELQAALNDWRPYQQARIYRQHLPRRSFNPYKWGRHFITQAMISYAEKCVGAHRSKQTARLWALRLGAEFLFLPWAFTPIMIVFMWLFGLGIMSFKVHQNNIPRSWSFGQLLPVFMVLLPLFTLVGTVADAKALAAQGDDRRPSGHGLNRLLHTGFIHHQQ